MDNDTSFEKISRGLFKVRHYCKQNGLKFIPSKRIATFVRQELPDLEMHCKKALGALGQETINHGCINKPLDERLYSDWRYVMNYASSNAFCIMAVREVDYRCVHCGELDRKKDKVYSALGFCVGREL